jgi:hypothetical protein
MFDEEKQEFPEINYIGLVDTDDDSKVFGVKEIDRRRHTYILGKSGMGKSTLLENMILQDIYQGKGCCFIDPLGDSAIAIMDKIPKYRHKDVIYFNPADRENSMGLNLLEKINDQFSPSLIVADIMSIMERIWSGAWSARMEYILSNALLALIENDEPHTLLGVLKMFNDQKFLEKVVEDCENMIVRNFWNSEYKQFPPSYKIEAIAAIQNKLGQLFANELIRNMLGQKKSTINFDDIVNNRKILICNLAKGQIGDGNSNLLGSLLVSKILMSIMARVNIKEKERVDFYLYIDEFQNFVNDSFRTILAEARKFRLCLTIAHQYLSQLDSKEDKQAMRDAIFGNTGTIITFQLGQGDAEIVGNEMGILEENHKHFLNLSVGQIIVKQSVDFKQLDPFVAYTLPRLYNDFSGNFEECMHMSNANYSREKEEVEKEINNYYKPEQGAENSKTRRADKRRLEREEKIRQGLIVPKNFHADFSEKIGEKETEQTKIPAEIGDIFVFKQEKK